MLRASTGPVGFTKQPLGEGKGQSFDVPHPLLPYPGVELHPLKRPSATSLCTLWQAQLQGKPRVQPNLGHGKKLDGTMVSGPPLTPSQKLRGNW